MPHGNVGEFKNNLLGFLDKNKLEEFYLMGHSLGGALAIDFAHQFPEKVQHLYLLDSEGVYQKQPLLQVLVNTLRQHPRYQNQTGHAWSSVKRVMRHPILHARLGHHAHNVDLQKEASQLQVPTTILWGEDDLVTPIDQGKRLHELIKDSEFISLKEEGHDWILYNPGLFWRNI